MLFCEEFQRLFKHARAQLATTTPKMNIFHFLFVFILLSNSIFAVLVFDGTQNSVISVGGTLKSSSATFAVW